MRSHAAARISAVALLQLATILSAQEETEKPEDPTAPAKEEPPPAEGEKAAGEDAVPPAEKEPEFKKETSRAEFSKGRVLFDEGKYKEAEAVFKKLRSDAKTKEDRAVVDSWVQGASGILYLEKLKPALRSGKRMAAYEQAESVARKYKGTPAEPQFKKFLEEIDSQIFVLLQGFDTVTKAYTEKSGKTFVEDPTVVYDGTRCLRWQSTSDKGAATLRVDGVPKDWTGFESLVFHLKSTRAPAGAEIILMSDSGGNSKTKRTAAETDLYQTPIRLPAPNGEWQRVTVRLSDFVPQGRPSFTNITGLQIQIAKGKDFDVLIDKMVLVRKEGAPDPEAKKAAKKKGKK